MKSPATTARSLLEFGPPFLHWWKGTETSELVDHIKSELGDRICVRAIDGRKAKDLSGLGRELGRATGSTVGGNEDAFHDALNDPHWFLGGDPQPTVYIVSEAARILADVPAGMASWGSKAEVMARSWARPVRKGQPWDHEPVPLHFIHCSKILPRDVPNMNRFELAELQ